MSISAQCEATQDAERNAKLTANTTVVDHLALCVPCKEGLDEWVELVWGYRNEPGCKTHDRRENVQ